jgi:hypothetical protein
MWLFYQVAQFIVDPRPYSEIISRWEFVIRGRQLDSDAGAAEAPDLRRAGVPDREGQLEESVPPEEDLSRGIRDVETAARLAGRIGSKTARPAAVMVILFLTLILIRIATALIEAGARLVGVLSGERALMTKLLKALNRDR